MIVANSSNKTKKIKKNEVSYIYTKVITLKIIISTRLFWFQKNDLQVIQNRNNFQKIQ